MLLHQKNKGSKSPRFIPLSQWVFLLSGPLQLLSPAAAHARHADEIAHVGLPCVSLLMSSSTRSYGSVKSAPAGAFSQQKLQIPATPCVLESTQAVYFADCPAKDASGLS